MQPDTPPSSTKPAPRSSALRYALALALLVTAIGGIAWVAQFLPSLSKKKPEVPSKIVATPLLEFPRWIAQWDNKKAPEKKDDFAAKEDHLPKEFEFGTEGRYDFPFKNISGQDVEVLHYVSTCDCTSVLVCALPMADWTSMVEQQNLKPGDDLVYAANTVWLELQSNQQQAGDIQKNKILTVKAGEAGVVRVRWTVKKTPGQTLRLTPHVVYRQAGVPDLRAQTLGVPVLVGTAIRFEPSRVHVGLLAPSSKPATAEFDAWSSTRPPEEFALKLVPLPANPLFHVETRPLSKKECADLESNLKSDKYPPRVRSGHHVTVTVYESKEGKQLDQGPFYQKLAIELNGFREPELPGPEIVGRVQGDIRIGGADDQGKILFKNSFQAGKMAQKTVELLADAKVQLETHTHEPAWLDVKVTRNKEQPDPKQHRWRLQVTVPENTPGVRSFEETDHVTLRIVGSPDRFVRIAIEGHVTGR